LHADSTSIIAAFADTSIREFDWRMIGGAQEEGVGVAGGVWKNSKYGASDRPVSALAIDRAVGTVVVGTCTGLVSFGKVSDHPSQGLPVINNGWVRKHEDIVSGITMVQSIGVAGEQGLREEDPEKRVSAPSQNLQGLVVVTASTDHTLTAIGF
jgi:hypothetical protein